MGPREAGRTTRLLFSFAGLSLDAQVRVTLVPNATAGAREMHRIPRKAKASILPNDLVNPLRRKDRPEAQSRAAKPPPPVQIRAAPPSFTQGILRSLSASKCDRGEYLH